MTSAPDSTTEETPISTPAADAGPVCECCGLPVPTTPRIDVLLSVPDAVFQKAHRHVHEHLLRSETEGSFLRCQLPTRLSDGTQLVFGSWIRISEEDAARAEEQWNAPEYAGSVFEGELANAIPPWGETMVGARVTATALVADEIPVVTGTEHEFAKLILDGEWDKDRVLSLYSHPLPVPIRVALDERWSVERSAGLADRLEGDSRQFAGDRGRRVTINILVPDTDLDPADQLGVLRTGTPWVHENDQLLEPVGTGVRHAIWYGTNADGREHFRLHGLVVERESTIAVGCEFDDLSDLPWAIHLWRSVAAAPVAAVTAVTAATAADAEGAAEVSEADA